MLAYLLLHFSKRAILWGPQGQIDWIEYTRLTANWLALYRYSPLPAYAELLYWLAVAVSALNLAGFMPRLMGLLFAVFASATLNRDWLAMDGGHSLLVVLSIYLVFADTSALSIVKRVRAPQVSQTAAIVHNAAMFAVSAQVCLMYYWAGFYKLFGVSVAPGDRVVFRASGPPVQLSGPVSACLRPRHADRPRCLRDARLSRLLPISDVGETSKADDGRDCDFIPSGDRRNDGLDNLLEHDDCRGPGASLRRSAGIALETHRLDERRCRQANANRNSLTTRRFYQNPLLIMIAMPCRCGALAKLTVSRATAP